LSTKVDEGIHNVYSHYRNERQKYHRTLPKLFMIFTMTYSELGMKNVCCKLYEGCIVTPELTEANEHIV